MKTKLKIIFLVILSLAIFSCTFVQSAIAAPINNKTSVQRVPWEVDGTFGVNNDGWFEAVHVDDVANGGTYTMNANRIRIMPAWKPSDSTTSQEELEIRLYRKWNNQLIYARRFMLMDDIDGKADAAGWWYCESPWIEINYGSDYYVQYELFTAKGYTGTGTTRKGDVSVWIELD